MLAQIVEELLEHVFGVDAVVEPRAPRLDRAADVVKAGVENEVAKLPAHHLLLRGGSEVVLARHLLPERSFVRHVDGQRHRHGFGHFHLEHPRDARPQELPANLAVCSSQS